MSQILRKAANLNGQDLLLTAQEIEFGRRRLTVSGEISDALAADLNAALRILAAESKDDITLYIQSPGGSVSAGLSIYDTAKSTGCDIVTVASGMAASMAAFLLAAAGTKGKRWCQPNAEVLIHQPLGGTSGQASDIRIQAEHILRTRAHLNRILSECTGQPIEKISADTERDYIMQAEDAVNYGLVDRIGDPAAEL